MKNEMKTQPSANSVYDFIDGLSDQKKKEDCITLVHIMQQITGDEPKMWGENIIGFGDYHYKYESGREGDWFITGFSPRKQNFSVYLTIGFYENAELLARLGKHKVGKSCLYFKNLDGVDIDILKQLIEDTVKRMR